jgi:hypothetical protein
VDPVQTLYDETSLALRMQVAAGFAIPPILPFRETVTVKSGERIEADAELQSRLNAGLKAIAEVNWCMPLRLKLDTSNEEFTLPVDPVISLSGKNLITRRYVAKSEKRGSVKEYWSQDDWSITISGILIADTADELKVLIKKLREICEQGKTGVGVTNDLLNNYMDITRLAIYDFDFPHTKGEENQSFVIKAWSDDLFQLIEENK